MLSDTALRTYTPFKKLIKDTLYAGIELSASHEKAEAFVLCSLFMGLRAGNDLSGFNWFADDLVAV